MSTRVLLTGATGYLGSRLAHALSARGYGLVVLKRASSPLDRIENLMPRLAAYDTEGLDFSLPFREHPDIAAVIHTATCYGRNGEGVEQLLEANLAFPLRLLSAAAAAGIGAFINADTSLDKYLNAYALSKRQFSEWGKHLAEDRRIRFLNTRLEHFYGPADDRSKFTSHVIDSCRANIPELKLTPGEQKRDFIYIDDVVTAFMTLLEQRNRIDGCFSEFDVGSGHAVSIRAFVEAVHRMSASRTRLAFGAIPYREGEPMLSQADTRGMEGLGWRCAHTLEQGLRLTMGEAKR